MLYIAIYSCWFGPFFSWLSIGNVIIATQIFQIHWGSWRSPCLDNGPRCASVLPEEKKGGNSYGNLRYRGEIIGRCPYFWELGYVTDTVDGPAKSQSPVENDGKHPMILFGFQASVGWCRISQPSTNIVHMNCHFIGWYEHVNGYTML